jgi:nucleoside-diphosphate-sugar epimerase
MRAKVTVTGRRGVLGRALVPLLQAEGHEVTVLTRRPDAQLPGGARRIVGDLASGAGLDAVVRDAGWSCLVLMAMASAAGAPVLLWWQ